MPIPIDLITHKRLVLIKQLYQHALIQSASHHSFVSQVMTIIEFDLAIDTVLKTLVNILNPQFDLRRNFHDLVDECEKLYTQVTTNLFPYKGQIKRVHDIRNDAQHKAKYPNPNDVSDCRTYTRDFLEQVISDVWDRSLSSISLTDLIQHSKAKQFLVNAEDALAKGDIKTAAEQAVGGVTWALHRAGISIVGESEPYPTSGEFLVQTDSLIKTAGKKAYRAFWKMQETLLIVTLGLDYAAYIHYKDTVSNVGILAYFLVNGTLKIDSGPMPNLDNNTAEYLVRYATDTVIQTENRVGDFDEILERNYRTWGDLKNRTP